MASPAPVAETAESLSVLWVAEVLDRPTAHNIIGLRRSGVDLDVITGLSCPHVTTLEQAGVPVTTLNIPLRYDRAAIAELKRRLEQKRYHVLHAFGSNSLGCGIQAARGIDIRIVTFRGYMGNVRLHSPASWMTYLHPRLDRIICGSNAIARYFHRHPIPIDNRKIVTIYKGHELAWYQAEPVDLTTVGVPAGAFTVAFSGRNRPRKGIHVLIEAAGLLPDDYQIHFVLAGKIEMNRRLERSLAGCPARDRIHFAGFRTDAPQLAGACDLFCLPSIGREGFSRAVVEAMAYGTPAISSDVGGMPEMVDHGVTGLIVPQKDPQALADAIQDLYENPELRERMGQAARERIDKVFNCRRTVRETHALYRKLTSTRR